MPCVIGETHPQTINIFMERARECGILGDGLETTDCRLWFADQCGYMRKRRLREAPECELKGEYQEKNLQTAYVALQVLKNYSPLNPQPSTLNIREGFARVSTLTGLHGRWETLATSPLILCDTGHNSHGLQYVAHQLKSLPCRELWIVFGMVNDKDTDVVMRLLPTNPHYHYIFTTPNTHRARSAEEMLRLWGKEGIAIDSPSEAIRYAREHARQDDAIFIGGSNYLVGEAIRILKTYNNKPQ